MLELQFNLAALVAGALCFALVGPQRSPGFLVALLVVQQLALAVLGRVQTSWAGLSDFAFLRLLAYGIFLHAPLLLAASALRLRREARAAAGLATFGAVALAATAAWAFLIEPHWLEVTHYRVETDMLSAPLRIAVLADLQTDELGDFERYVLEELRDLQADLVLLPGDYLQRSHRMPPEPGELTELYMEFRALWREVGVTAPLGVFAVGGDVEPLDWHLYLQELGIHTFGKTGTVDLGPVQLTGLTAADSRSLKLRTVVPDKFHIVLGHSPDFALGDLDVELLVAGHTHGGQVRLPLLGPMMTLSRVPRGWAAGLTDMGDDKHLFVSRGVGMERGWAPRLRFLCRPELAVIELVPAPPSPR